MPNSSATGGYLLPTSIAPLNDSALLDFLHDVIVSATGISNSLVRPAYQPNPPTRPDLNVNWVGFATSNHEEEDGGIYLKMNEDGLGSIATRHETFNLRCSFYGPNCQGHASQLRDNLEIGQNRDQLTQGGIAVVDNTPIQQAPELVNQKWYDRADITFRLRRQLDRNYAILSFVAAAGTISTETETVNWATGPEA